MDVPGSMVLFFCYERDIYMKREAFMSFIEVRTLIYKALSNRGA